MEHRYEDLGWRTPFVVIALGLNVVLGLVASGVGLLAAESDMTLVLAAVLLPAILANVATFVCAVIAVCLWTYRACANAHNLALAADWVAPELTPGWAVGYYFVPFANLVKPYQSMREIDSASLGEPATDPKLGLWWATWIIGNLLANIGFRLDSPAADFAGAAAHAVAGVTLILLMRRMHETQRARRAELDRKAAPQLATFREAPAGAVPHEIE